MTGTKEHATRKRMLSNIYSKSFLQSSPILKIISETIIYDRFLPILDKAASAKSALDVHDLNQALTMDFVSAYLFGLQNATNFLQDLSTRKFMLHNYQCRKPFEFYYQEVPSLVTFTESIGIPVIPKWCQEAGTIMNEWNMDLCDKAEQCLESTDPHVEPTAYKQLKRSMMKQIQTKKDDPEWNAQVLKQQKIDVACEMFDQLTAGHETSAVGLTYLFWELSRHPEIQNELREEMQSLEPPISCSVASEGSRGLPNPKMIDGLPLLQAIVMETLRLHAPIPGIQPRITPAPSSSLGGHENIPAKIRVNAQAYSLHRNPEVFPEPETWQPRRWLQNYDSPEMEEMRRWFWAFGSGGRMCVGSNLALQGMHTRDRISLSCHQHNVRVRTLQTNCGISQR
jgi:cytochrome P450